MLISWVCSNIETVFYLSIGIIIINRSNYKTPVVYGKPSRIAREGRLERKARPLWGTPKGKI